MKTVPSSSTKRRLRYEPLCKGPNKDLARYHKIMAIFYRLPIRYQRAFMAMIEELANAK